MLSKTLIRRKAKRAKKAEQREYRAKKLAEKERKALEVSSELAYLAERSTKRYKNYQLTKRDYQKKLKEQDSKCSICLNEETKTTFQGKVISLSVDHCHRTNRVRGLLCSKCNLAIGLFKENITSLQNAINYLIKHNQ